MNTFASYTLREVVLERNDYTIYAAEDLTQKKPVVLQLVPSDMFSAQSLASIRSQYALISEFSSKERHGIPPILEYIDNEKGAALVLETVHATSLNHAVKQGWTFLDTLYFIEKTAETLAILHDANIMHKDLTPHSLFVQGRGSAMNVLLFDFRLASQLASEKQEISAASTLHANLLYISPEQTGRMNRIIDYRTDFYSLGVIFYELLTGTLPATGFDEMQIIYAHLAKRPPAPHEVNAQIPHAVSDIVMKLLAKNAEDRYNTAYGLLADIQECITQWSAHKTITGVIAGQYDTSSSFSIPQKIYGRERETKCILDTFDHVATTGASQLLLVGGYSGIGKSMLVHETHKPITERRGYFIAGKFDQFQRNIPFNAIVQAFRGLMKQILSESNEQLATWKNKITEALGENVQIIIEVIPELERVVGKQKPVIELPPSENQNRFYRTFDMFIRVFARKEHPLVMFIDDLQWADGATLNLLKTLFSNNEPAHFLVLGAYRDNEVDAAHPFTLTVTEIKKFGYPVETLILQPLAETHIEQFLADTLKTTPANVADLTRLVINKTVGNPFFMIEFLKTLYAEKLLNFDRSKHRWVWNVADITAKGITDNVVELMVNKLKKLPPETQEILQIGACVGNQFNLQTLASVTGKSVTTIAVDLWSAVQEGLIIPLGAGHQLLKNLGEHPDYTDEVITTKNTVDKFSHDRVQQAAYSMLAEEARKNLHYSIGTILLKTYSDAEREEKLFDIVNQINQGLQYAASEQERDEYARLNLHASQKAKESTAYQPALMYAETALRLLGDNPWKRRYALTLEINNQQGELQMLLAEYDTMNTTIEHIHANASNFMDTLHSAQTRIYALKLRSEHEEAVRKGLEVLRQLGVKFPDKGSKLTVIKAIVQAKIALRSGLPAISNLKSLTDERIKAACDIMDSIAGSSYNANQNLSAAFPPTVLALNMKHGFLPSSATAFMNYSAVLASILGDVKGAKEICDFAFTMLRQFGSAGQRVYHTTLFSYAFLLQYWFEPLQNIRQTYTEVYRKALELGDLEYAGYSIGDIPYTLFWYGAPMEEIIADSTIAHQACAKMNQTSALDYVKIFEQTVWNLTNERPDPDSLTGEWYDESEIEVSRRIGRKSNIVEAYFAKTALAFFWGKYRTIIDEYVPGFEEYEIYMTASFFIPLQNFFTGMAFFALAHQENEPKRQRIKQGVRRMNMIKKLAAIMPFNTQHFYELLQAEYYSATGKMSKAASLYEQAIATAKKNSFQNVVCIAEEAAGRHYLRIGNRTIAEVYLQKAVQSYVKWGVSAKVLQLQREFADFSLSVLEENTPQSSSVQVSGNNGSLDMLSVVKSSQVLAGEIELRTLLEKMLTIVKENAGAEKCVVVLNEPQGGQASLFIQAESAGDKVSSVLQRIPLASSQSVPITLLNAVARLQTSVVLGDASNSADYKNDTYIKQYNVKSVLCNPIVNQGNLVGVLYIENNLATEAFTPDRIQVLNVLSSQIAVSIENARYYRDIQAMNYTLEQKVQERTAELEEKNKQLTELNAEKNELMGIVSHDLKNPIGAVRNYAELIENKIITGDEVAKVSSQIVQVSERMLDLVTNLLDMNYLESGGIQLSIVNFDIAPLVEYAAYQYHVPAEVKSITIHYNKEAEKSIVFADEQAMIQVLDNLVSNAVKYSPHGKNVFVRVKSNEKAVRVEVEDEGPGISEEDMKKLFGKFARLSAQPTGGEHSTGLGLSIVKKMVEAMKGRVWCESEPGKGATFIVEMPLVE